MNETILMLMGVIFISIVIQFLIEAVKSPITALCKFKKKEDRYGKLVSPFIAITAGVILCWQTGCGLFQAFGFPLHESIIDYIVSGFIVSLGAGKVYDLITSARSYREKLASEDKK